MNFNRLRRSWTRLWMRFSGYGFLGRMACGLAAIFSPPYYGRVPLARIGNRGYFALNSTICHSNVKLGNNIFIGNRVLIYEDKLGGGVKLDNGVHLHNDLTIQTGEGGAVKIGEHTHVQPRCQFSAYKGSIKIGAHVEIAPNCAFYSYDHGIDPNSPIRSQSIQSRGGIVIEDDVWVGYGTIILDGVHIGNGAVIGAGSVVTSNVPAGAIAVGVPARVVKFRDSEKNVLSTAK